MADQALAGIKVLDLTQDISGPYCTKVLADHGADVIKVEPPDGDPSRREGPFFHDEPDPEKSLLFFYLNTNKRSITLDLETLRGRAIARALADWADVIVENRPPGALARYGLDFVSLSQNRPELIYTSITPFGQTGPYRDYKATDIVGDAMGGFMYVVGYPDREPLQHGNPQAQYRSGSNGAVATLLALVHRDATGEGQWVDVSTMESYASTLRDTVEQYTYWGAVRKRSPRGSLLTGQLARVKDGYIMPSTFGGDMALLASFLGKPELNDPRFATGEGQNQYNEELQGLIRDAFLEREKLELFEAAQEWRFSFGIVLAPKEVVTSPQMAHRGFFTEAEHSVLGRLTMPGEPFHMSGTPWTLRRPAPLLGQHNAEVLCGMLGYGKDDLVRLRQLGVI